MSRTLVQVIGFCIVIGLQAAALAEFCPSYSAAYPKTVFCDDFDRDCTSPPPAPSRCPDGSPVNPTATLSTWQPMDPGLNQCPGTTMLATDESTRIDSSPFGGRYPCQSAAHLGQEEVNLVPGIQANPNFGPAFTAVNGTNANPLYLYFVMNGGNCSSAGNCNLHIQYDNGYMELGLDSNDGAPMDFVKVGMDDGTGTCIDCFHTCPGPNFSVHVPWPTICQSYTARAINPGKCPPAMTNVRKALAVGAVALLDNNPCHCETPADQVPQNSHLAYYDGLKWRALTQGQFPGSGDFVMGTKRIAIQMWIRTSTVDITMTTNTPITNAQVVSTATGIPRQYTGAFNKLRAGAAHGCELNNGSYTCNGNDTCFRTGEFRCDLSEFQDSKASNIVFDDVWVLPGIGATSTTTGACCLPDSTSCQMLTQTQCQTANGSFNGIASSCDTTVCCPTPFADTDNDNDVDMDDFGRFQRCYTSFSGGSGDPFSISNVCKCFDRNHDGAINQDDFDSFVACVAGPGRPPLCP